MCKNLIFSTFYFKFELNFQHNFITKHTVLKRVDVPPIISLIYITICIIYFKDTWTVLKYVDVLKYIIYAQRMDMDTTSGIHHGCQDIPNKIYVNREKQSIGVLDCFLTNTHQSLSVRPATPPRIFNLSLWDWDSWQSNLSLAIITFERIQF